ncbi:hypothetical protein H0H87_012868 [Tephrocybe sp. NHM501043]|nr:hypothetical protein H0H87_012868 [Tephrocybe sp. NHM501043]
MEPQDSLQAKYWLSYQLNHRQPERVPAGYDSAVVTVVLDSEARKQFDGIRVIFICTVGARELKRVRDCSSKSEKREQSFCTVIFELYQLGSGLSLRLWEQSTLDGLSESLYVLHDLKYSFPVLYATFITWGNSWLAHSMWKTMHNVRVLPLPSQRRAASAVHDLPKENLLHIIRYALGKRDRGWRTELMHYGSVCRAWTHTLDLFFESVQSRNCKDRPTAHSVAQALEQCPSRKALLSAFIPTAYREHYDNSRYFEFSDACVRILGLTTNLTSVTLPVIAVSVWEELLRTLRSLRGVRKCSLQAQTIHRPSAITRQYSIDDVQAIVGGWKHLRTLRCEGWIPDIVPSDSVRTQSYYLKELCLSTGHITGTQICRFVLCNSSSRLKRLSLFSVTGLTNDDLRELLSIVAPTLSTLHIQNTHAPRASADEPYALDATIASMPRVKCATLDGDHMSALSISRKWPGFSKHKGTPEADLRGTITLIIHREFEVLDAQRVLHALRETGWKHVMVWWNRKMAWNADTVWDEERFKQLAPSIQKTGVHLRLRFFDRSLRLTPSVVKYKPGWSPMLLDLY